MQYLLANQKVYKNDNSGSIINSPNLSTAGHIHSHQICAQIYLDFLNLEGVAEETGLIWSAFKTLKLNDGNQFCEDNGENSQYTKVCQLYTERVDLIGSFLCPAERAQSGVCPVVLSNVGLDLWDRKPCTVKLRLHRRARFGPLR